MTVISIGREEARKGKSDGDENPDATRLEKLKSLLILPEGKGFQELLDEEEPLR